MDPLLHAATSGQVGKPRDACCLGAGKVVDGGYPAACIALLALVGGDVSTVCRSIGRSGCRHISKNNAGIKYERSNSLLAATTIERTPERYQKQGRFALSREKHTAALLLLGLASPPRNSRDPNSVRTWSLGKRSLACSLSEPPPRLRKRRRVGHGGQRASTDAAPEGRHGSAEPPVPARDNSTPTRMESAFAPGNGSVSRP